MQQLPLGVRLRERATFDAFVVSPANAEAVSRLQALADGGRGVLWLWGAQGTGRSHLLQAACAAAPASNRVGYLPLLGLEASGEDLLEGAGSLDLLCLDDLDSRVGGRDFELAMFSAYRAIEEARHALVVAASAPPAALPWALPDLGSRCGAAEIFQLRPLDDAQQEQALRQRASARGLDLPEETLRYVLRRFPRDMTSLGRLLEQIDEASLSAQRRLTVPFVRAIIGDAAGDP
jgi:DnaA family protein